MKKIIFFIVILLSVLSVTYSQTQKKLTGGEIASLILNTRKTAGGLVLKGDMEVVSLAANTTDNRNFTIIISSGIAGTTTVFRFNDPKLNQATFMSIEKKGNEPEIFIYFKSYKQPVQMRARHLEKNFLDTDITAEDLGNIKLEEYTYKRLDDVSYAVDGIYRNCYVIESYPKVKSYYSKHIMIVDKEWLIPIIYKSYNETGMLVKQFSSSDIRKINDKRYMPFIMKISNLEKKHETNVKFISILQKKVDINLKMMTEQWTE